MELAVTGANALTYPASDIWNWTTSIYLFLISAAAGLLIMCAFAVLWGAKARPELKHDVLPAIMAVPALLVFGMVIIWLELQARQNIHWLFLSGSYTSPMFWGGWALVVTLIFSSLFFLSMLADDRRADFKFGFFRTIIGRLAPHARTFAGICFGLGILLGLYTGLSLSLFVARPLWNSAVVPFIFLVSAATIGAASMIILSRQEPVQLYFTRVLTLLLGAEALAAFLYFVGQLTSSAANRRAVEPLFEYSGSFFPLVLSFALLGIILPLALGMGLMRVKGDLACQVPRAGSFTMRLCALLVLAGGMLMRLGWVYLGQLSALS